MRRVIRVQKNQFLQQQLLTNDVGYPEGTIVLGELEGDLVGEDEGVDTGATEDCRWLSIG